MLVENDQFEPTPPVFGAPDILAPENDSLGYRMALFA